MRNHIIETFLEKGHITKEAAERLEEFDAMVKESVDWSKVWEKAKDIAAQMAPSLAAIGVAGAAGHIVKRQQQKSENQALGSQIIMSKRLLENEGSSFQENPEAAAALFDEVANLAPFVAAKPLLINKIIHKYKDTGLDYNATAGLIHLQKNMKHTEDLTRVNSGMQAAIGEAVSSPVRLMVEDTVAPWRLSRGAAALDDRLKGKEAEINQLNQFSPDQVLAGLERAKNKNRNMPKLGSFEPDVNTLADHYPFIKVALKFKWGDTAKVIGSLMAVGLGISAADKLYKIHREDVLNEDLDKSWGSTINRLRASSDTGSGYSAGIDYGDPAIRGQAQEAFKTLATLSPSLALNPMTASTFITKAIQNEAQLEPDLLKTISEIQRNITSSKKDEDDVPFKGSLLGKPFQNTIGAAKGFIPRGAS